MRISQMTKMTIVRLWLEFMSKPCVQG